MTVVETVLVFAGIPLGIVLVIALITVAPSAVRTGGARYRPGRPWEYQTAWWLPEPEAVGPRSHAVQAEHRHDRGVEAAARCSLSMSASVVDAQ